MRPTLSDLTNSTEDEEERAAMRKAMICNQLAGRAIIRVVGRCNDAKENENLECQLIQIPEAVFHLMRNTDLKTCDLSYNVITKIPAKLGTKFSSITALNISNNRMSKLPDELAQLQELTKLDISYNGFVSFPRVAYSLPKLEVLNAEKNYIADIDAKRLVQKPSLVEINFKRNPLSQDTHQALSQVSERIQVLLTPIEDEDEDINFETEERRIKELA